MTPAEPHHSEGEQSSSIPLSVLIVTYHSETVIANCINSLMPELNHLGGEVIVVDNASKDGTQGVLDELQDKHEALQVIHNRGNRGFATGNNQALDASSGQDVLILNPDTQLNPGVLKGLLTELHKAPEIGMVAPQLRFPDGRVQKTCRRFPTHGDVIYPALGLARLFPKNQRFNGWKMGDFDHRSRRRVDQPAGAAMMVRGDLLRSLGGFDENFPMFFNDVDLCKRIHDSGAEIWFTPEHVITHVGGDSVNQVKIKMILSSHVSFFRYLEKHFIQVIHQPLNFVAALVLYLSLIPRVLLALLGKGRSQKQRDTL